MPSNRERIKHYIKRREAYLKGIANIFHDWECWEKAYLKVYGILPEEEDKECPV